MAISMLGGAQVNATGAGAMTVSVMVGTAFITSTAGPNAVPIESQEIKLADCLLTPDSWKDYDAGGRGQNEKMRLRFTNGAKADCYFGIKQATLFTRPLYSGRSGGGG